MSKEDDDKPVENMTQGKLQELIDKAFARGAENSAQAKEVKEQLAKLKTLETEHQAATTELTELREKLKAATPKPDDKSGAGGGDDQRIKELEAQIDSLKAEYGSQIDSLKTELTSSKTHSAQRETAFQLTQLRGDVVAAANEAGAHNPEDVFHLMAARQLFRRDEEGGTVHVLGKNGKIMLDVDEGGDPVSLTKGVARYVEENPHLKRSTGRTGGDQGGAGNAGGQVQIGEQAVSVDKLTPSQTYQNKDAILQGLKDGSIGKA